METEVLGVPIADTKKDKDTSEHRQFILRYLDGSLIKLDKLWQDGVYRGKDSKSSSKIKLSKKQEKLKMRVRRSRKTGGQGINLETKTKHCQLMTQSVSNLKC